MFVPLGIKTDYSLLKSLIKIDKLVEFLKEQQITACGLVDDNLFSAIAFYKKCLANDIKPLIGLEVIINDYPVYLYAANYAGFKNLIKINTIINDRCLSIQELKLLKANLIAIVPYAAYKIYADLKPIINKLFLGYSNDQEKQGALIISPQIVYFNLTLALKAQDQEYLTYLEQIRTQTNETKYLTNYLIIPEAQEWIKTTEEFSALIDLTLPKNNNLLPQYDPKLKNSWTYLVNLCRRGLAKRIPGEVPTKYLKRLKYELNVIKEMGFADYFLIVYDYVKFAKNNHILVGPGRGSAASSLVAYVLGITNIDPLTYNLLFERFLNPERITMPDIDLDFEFTKREEVITYIRNRYGEEHVALIMTFGTLSSKQVVRDVGKCFQIDPLLIDQISNILDSQKKLQENLTNPRLLAIVNNDQKLKLLFKVSLHLEGLKRHISTHAAGIVITSEPIGEIIPVYYESSQLITGVTMEYLEDLGLLKMDLLALKNLTVIQNVITLVRTQTKEDIKLNEIPLNDEKTYELFKSGQTEGIFQFETGGMKKFITKLKPTLLADIIAATALFRPGPMANIDSFIARKAGTEPITYLHPLLEPILAETYGIIVYQEQIMQILVQLGGYTYAQADNIRRAMSKKQKTVIVKEQANFVEQAVKNNINAEVATAIYELILKFANYGFNKAHSVPYALISYQMAYLKSNYPLYFITTLLNMSIGSEIKTKEYLAEAKKYQIKLIKPNINQSNEIYEVIADQLLLPLNTIKNVNQNSIKTIINERETNGLYEDYFAFVARTYNQGVNSQVIEALIASGALDIFGQTRQTLSNGLDQVLTYAELSSDLDRNLVMKPTLEILPEYSETELMQKELASYGFYITNHPCSKYQATDIIKLDQLKQYFDKYIKTVVIINRIKQIKTKKNEDMAFVNAADETASGEYVIFPKNKQYLSQIKPGSLVIIKGQVTKRIDEYQIVVSKIELVEEDHHE